MPNTPERDVVAEARHLLNHPGWREPFGSDARRVVMALCDEVERLRGVVEEWESAAGAAFQDDTNGVY